MRHVVAFHFSKVLVTEPAGHSAQLENVDALLYFPATHAVQFTAPDDPSVSVTDPAPHTSHATVDALLYCPAEHAVQLTAPMDPKLSVIDPAEHTMQLV